MDEARRGVLLFWVWAAWLLISVLAVLFAGAIVAFVVGTAIVKAAGLGRDYVWAFTTAWCWLWGLLVRPVLRWATAPTEKT